MIDLLSPLAPSLGLPVPTDAGQRFVLTLVAWFIVAVLAYAGMHAGRVVTRRTGTKWDNVLVSRTQTPIWVVFLLVATLDALSPWRGITAGQVLRAVVTIALISALVWLVQRLAVDVALRVAQRRAAATATGMDDLLVPIVRGIVRPVAIGIGAMFALQAAGLPIAGAALLVGGASFVLAFALQSTLEDVFGGVGLVVDTPFAPGDVIRLQNGTLCEVVGLGMRVTRLYNANDHSIITYSNKGLVQQEIVNLSRPSPDMGLSVNVRVARDSDTRVVWERLTEAGHAHPWALGDAGQKLPAMRRRMDRLVRVHDYRRAFETIKELNRVAAESDLNAAIERLARHIVEYASRAHFLEQGGFDSEERREIETTEAELHGLVREVKRCLTVWLLTVRYTYVSGRVCTMSPECEADLDRQVRAILTACDGDVHRALDQIHAVVDDQFAFAFARADEYVTTVKGWVESVLAGDGKAPAICIPGSTPDAEAFFHTEQQEAFFQRHGFGAGLVDRANGGIGDLDQVEEYLALFAEWNQKMLLLESRVKALDAEVRGSSMLLDENLHDLRRWLATDFKEPTPEWKYPRTPLVGIGDKLEYELKVYVDNVRLSHFTRARQVETQLRLDVLHLLRDHYPPVAFESGEPSGRPTPEPLWEPAVAS